MTTSQNSIFSEALRAETISESTLSALRLRLRIALHQCFIEEFLRQEGEGLLTRARFARRIDKQPAVVTRCLGEPGNFTLDTISDLFAGLGGEPGGFSFSQFVAEEEAPAVKADDMQIAASIPTPPTPPITQPVATWKFEEIGQPPSSRPQIPAPVVPQKPKLAA